MIGGCKHFNFDNIGIVMEDVNTTTLILLAPKVSCARPCWHMPFKDTDEYVDDTPMKLGLVWP